MMEKVFFALRLISNRTYLVLAVLWTGLTLYLSIASAATMKKLDLWSIVGLDKLGHAGFYAVFAFMWLMYARHRASGVKYVMSFSIGFGIAMELAQYMMRVGRAFEIFDICANIGGAMIGYWVYKRLIIQPMDLNPL